MRIDLRHICKSFPDKTTGEVKVFDDLSESCGDGEITAILGPNGSGKSTLLNMIVQFEAPDGGTIGFDGTQGSTPRIGYMMQEPMLLPWLTAIENAVLGAELAGDGQDITRIKAMAHFVKLDMSELVKRFPTKLSGGEKQKVALIRTLLVGRDLLLLDEPFSAIDARTRLELQMQVRSTAKADAKTVLFVTHDVDEALLVADRAIVLGPRLTGVRSDVRLAFGSMERTPEAIRQDHRYGLYFKELSSALKPKK